jgi:HSP20 family molecular chaperone IbpA
VTQTDYGLQVKGDRSATPAKKYLFQGIATRQFKKTFPIAPNVSVDRVVFQNGMLEVHLTENEGEDLNIEIA